MIDNPFSVIERRFNCLESLLLEIRGIQQKQYAVVNTQLVEDLIKMPEVTQLLGISGTTARKWMRQGILPFHRKGNRVFFFKSEVLKSLEQPLKRKA